MQSDDFHECFEVEEDVHAMTAAIAQAVTRLGRLEFFHAVSPIHHPLGHHAVWPPRCSFGC